MDPPAIACPASQTRVSPSGQAMPVVFQAPSVTGGAAPIATACTPVSGSTFAVGTTAVTCTATDSRQRTASCNFNVVIQPPARIRLTRFVAFGDSITFGEDGNTFGLDRFTRLPFVLEGRQYPFVLQQRLAERYTTQAIVVDNEGLRAEWAGGTLTLSRFSNLMASRRYESVLIMEGTNDLSDRDARRIVPAAQNLTAMIRDARSRSVRPYIATIPPIDRTRPRGSRYGWDLVDALNDEIRRLAAREGVTLVDVHQAFAGNLSLLSEDGLHPNAEGFARIADTFFQALRGTLEESPTTVRGVGAPGPVPPTFPWVTPW